MARWVWGLLLLPVSLAAASLEEAASDLARRVLSALGPDETLTVQSQSLSPASMSVPLQNLLERLLAVRIKPAPGAALNVTASGNMQGPLLVAELLRGEESTVFLAPYDAPATSAHRPTVKLALAARLVWEQSDPILDVYMTGSAMVVLEPSRLFFYTRGGGGWQIERALPIPFRPRPRDVRGRLIPNDGELSAYLAGQTCLARFSNPVMQCDERGGEWPLDAGTRVQLVAGRNYFTSPLLPPFYSAARWANQWLVATVSGPAQLHDSEGRLIAALGDWGTDLATVESACSGERYAVGLRGTALVAFTLDAGRRPAPATAPLPIAGRLTALWPSDQPAILTAIVQLSESHRYAAYRVSLSCGD